MKYIFPFLILALLASCFNEGDCLITATNRLHLQFKKRTNTKLDTLVPFKSIVVSGTDSVVVFKSAQSDILLPVDIRLDSTEFIFNRLDKDNQPVAPDTLRIGYTRQARVISKDCGAYMYYSGLKIFKTNLPSDRIKSFRADLLKDPSSSANTAYALNYQILY